MTLTGKNRELISSISVEGASGLTERAELTFNFE